MVDHPLEELPEGYFRVVPGVTAKFVTGLLILVGGAAGVETAANFVVVGFARREKSDAEIPD